MLFPHWRSMFQIGDLVEYQMGNIKIVGFVECFVDGKVGVRWLNNGNEFPNNHLSIFINPLDYLRKVDKVEE
jgi:hypothetical protein